MPKYSINEVLEMAVQTEKLGFAFYTEMASRFKGSRGLRELFTTLADKERAHEAVFSQLQDKIGAREENEEEGWQEVGNYMRAMVQSEFFLGSGKSLPALEHITSVQEAVDFALGFEKETLLFFLGLQGMVREKAVVEDVINEEKTHIAWLDRFREAL